MINGTDDFCFENTRSDLKFNIIFLIHWVQKQGRPTLSNMIDLVKEE